MGFLKNIWVWLSGTLIASLVFLRSLIFYKFRLIGQDATLLLDYLKDNGKFYSTEEEIAEERMPSIFIAWCWLEKIPFSFSVSERMMKAGMSGTDTIASILLLRFHKKKFKKLIHDLHIKLAQKNEIQIRILEPWNSTKIGTLQIPKQLPIPFIDESEYINIEKDVSKTILNNDKLGILLYGPPGNGKSYFIRYIALKYRLPIYIVSLKRDLDNHDLIRMFSNVRGPAVVLFEDFDEFFDRRIPLVKFAKFTFDVLLNVFDGVFSSPKGLIFCMTANNIQRIDRAIKSRPSRFKYIRSIPNPDRLIRNRIFTSLNSDREQAIKLTDGFSLDTILYIRDRINEGLNIQDALKDCEQYNTEVEEMNRIIEENKKKDKEDKKEKEEEEKAAVDA